MQLKHPGLFRLDNSTSYKAVSERVPVAVGNGAGGVDECACGCARPLSLSVSQWWSRAPPVH